MTVKVSVIVPFYNAEAHLPRCIESLVCQTLEACEFVFVNDGSSDGGAAVVDRYRYYDARIILVNRSNGGAASARNTGMDYARGKYVGFVDADDYVSNDLFERLYRAAEADDCDVVMSNLESELDGHLLVTRYPIPRDTVLTKDNIREQLLPLFLEREDLNSACNKLYLAERIRKHGVQFPAGVPLGEDGWFNMMYFSVAERLKYIDYTGYRYCEVKGSATRDAGTDYFRRSLEVYRMEPPSVYAGLLDRRTIRKLKAIKLVNSVMAHIHICLYHSEGSSLGAKTEYIKFMIGHAAVREALPHYLAEKGGSLGRYERWLLHFVERQSIWGLYAATGYSKFRNRKKWRKQA